MSSSETVGLDCLTATCIHNFRSNILTIRDQYMSFEDVGTGQIGLLLSFSFRDEEIGIDRRHRATFSSCSSCLLCRRLADGYALHNCVALLGDP